MSLSNPSYIGFFAVILSCLRAAAERCGAAGAAVDWVKLGFYQPGQFYIATSAVSFRRYHHVAGVLIQRCAETRWSAFTIAMLAVVTPLILLKYLVFICDSVGFAPPSAIAELALPVGLSYFTFVAIGYLIDAFRHHQRLIQPAASGGVPHLLPACHFRADRAGRTLSAAARCRSAVFQRAGTFGIALIFIGLVLKVLLADALAVSVAACVLAQPDGSPLEKFIAMLFFPSGISAPISAGYSLIAIGSAKMLGAVRGPAHFVSRSQPVGP